VELGRAPPGATRPTGRQIGGTADGVHHVRKELRVVDVGRGEVHRQRDVLTAADHTFGLAGAPAPLDRAGLQRFMAASRAAFPDLRVTVEQLVGEGDAVAARWRACGTHRGALLGIAPTGTAVAGTGVNHYRIAGGAIAADWNSADFLGLLLQLGVVPPLALTDA
jgi:predicted ester cyclase